MFQRTDNQNPVEAKKALLFSMDKRTTTSEGRKINIDKSIQLTNQEGVQGAKSEIACQHKTFPAVPRQLLKRLAPQLSDFMCNSQLFGRSYILDIQQHAET